MSIFTVNGLVILSDEAEAAHAFAKAVVGQEAVQDVG